MIVCVVSSQQVLLLKVGHSLLLIGSWVNVERTLVQLPNCSTGQQRARGYRRNLRSSGSKIRGEKGGGGGGRKRRRGRGEERR